jgi:serine/threonine-protein kinase
VPGSERDTFCSQCGALLTGGKFCAACGAALSPRNPPAETPPLSDGTSDGSGPRQIGRFQVLATIGRGGFATVYRAEDLELRRQVALKVLHPHLAADQDFVRRFRDEARAAARLHHRNIVAIYDVATTDTGQPYLVMELLQGTLLSERLGTHTPLPPAEVISLVAQLASALDYLHANGLIHRDLKPSNVMLDRVGVATLMDFGIARSLSDEARLTLPGQLFGTPAYMAPELIAGENVTAAADVYSLAILAYEMFAGRPPFEGNTQRILYAQAYEQPAPLRHVPDAAWQAIQRALDKDPARRYATAGEFALALAGAMTSTAATDRTLTGDDATELWHPTITGNTDLSLPEHTVAATAEPQRQVDLLPADASPAGGDPNATLVVPNHGTAAGSASAAASKPPHTLADAAGRFPAVRAEAAATPIAAKEAPPEAVVARPEPRRGNRLLAVAGLVALLVLVLALGAGLLLSRRRAAPTGRAASKPSVPPTALAGSGPAPAAPAGQINLRITAPSEGAAVNSTVLVSVEQSGAVIKPATDNDPNAAHYHYFIDRNPDDVLKPGQPIPTGQPDIIHSASPSLAIPDLKPGQHHVWVVLAHTDHTPYSPNIQRDVTFTVVPAASAVQTVAGSGRQGVADGAGSAAQFSNPAAVAVDASGNLYVADTGNSRIRRITPAGVVSTIAGSGAGQFDHPRGVAVDRAGNVYVADTGNNQIRRIAPDGTVTTLAGSGSPGLGGGGLVDGPGAQAQFKEPIGIAVDADGNVYVADSGNNRIRKVTPDGRVSTLAGSGPPGSGGFADGPGASARFNAPRGVAVDSSGNLYVADTLNQRIRKITPDGTVSTLAGTGDQGTANGAASAALFSNPDGVAVDSSGNVFVSDNASFRLRQITASGLVFDLAGTTREGFADGSPDSAQFDFPAGLAVDRAGDVYVADSYNNRIREVLPAKR